MDGQLSRALWFFFFLVVANSAVNAAFTIAPKNQNEGPSVHRTYFRTPFNREVEVSAQVYVGHLSNTGCVFNETDYMGMNYLKTGDYVEFDASKIKTYFGSSYDCMAVYYRFRQLSIERFALFFDGINYWRSYPAMKEVEIFLIGFQSRTVLINPVLCSPLPQGER